jgi:hypothetical protein
MKINKALKLKNKLIKKANTEMSRVSSNNVYRADRLPTYNSKENLENFLKTIEEIIELKTQIHQANFNIYAKIFRMSELKNVISKLRSISTSEPRSYGEVGEVIYVVDISERDKDEMIEKYELEIEKIQEELEAHNHTKDI